MHPPSGSEREDIGPADEVEKPAGVLVDKDEEIAMPVSTALAIDPLIEKRVLRKLDRRVPVVTAFLCMDSTGSKRK